MNNVNLDNMWHDFHIEMNKYAIKEVERKINKMLINRRENTLYDIMQRSNLFCSYYYPSQFEKYKIKVMKLMKGEV